MSGNPTDCMCSTISLSWMLFYDCVASMVLDGLGSMIYLHYTAKLLTDNLLQLVLPSTRPLQLWSPAKMYSKVVSSFRTMHTWKANRVPTNSSKGRFKILRVKGLWECWRCSVSALWSSWHISMHNDLNLWRYDHPLFQWHHAQWQLQFASREQHEWHDSDHTVLEPGEGNSQLTQQHGPILTPLSLPLPLEMQRPHLESPANAAKREFSWV